MLRRVLFICLSTSFTLHTLNMMSVNGGLRVDDEDSDRAVQAMIIVAFGFYGTAIVLASMVTFQIFDITDTSDKFTTLIVSVLAILGAVCTVAGIAMFHAEVDSEMTKTGSPVPYNTAIYCVAAISAVAGAILACLAAQRPRSVNGAMMPQQPGMQIQNGGYYNPAFSANSPATVQGQGYSNQGYRGNSQMVPSNPTNPQPYVYLEPPLTPGEGPSQQPHPEGGYGSYSNGRTMEHPPQGRQEEYPSYSNGRTQHDQYYEQNTPARPETYPESYPGPTRDRPIQRQAEAVPTDTKRYQHAEATGHDYGSYGDRGHGDERGAQGVEFVPEGDIGVSSPI